MHLGDQRSARHYISLAKSTTIKFRIKISANTKIIGDTSIPPRFGKMFLIGRRTGSVILYKKSTTK